MKKVADTMKTSTRNASSSRVASHAKAGSKPKKLKKGGKKNA